MWRAWWRLLRQLPTRPPCPPVWPPGKPRCCSPVLCPAAGTVLMQYVSQVHVVLADQTALSTRVASWQAKVQQCTS